MATADARIYVERLTLVSIKRVNQRLKAGIAITLCCMPNSKSAKVLTIMTCAKDEDCPKVLTVSGSQKSLIKNTK